MHLRSLWEGTREIQARFTNEGLGQVVQQVNDRLSTRWGGMALSSRSGLEFGEWRLSHLIRRMRSADYPTRLRMLREQPAHASAMQRIDALLHAAQDASGQHPNVDFALASLCHVYALPASAALVLFAAGRLAGWLAHALEQQALGKLIRPRASYTGIEPDHALAAE